MTPEQCADMIIAEIREADRMAFSYYRPEMVKLIGQAIAAERKVCAKIAETKYRDPRSHGHFVMCCEDIAVAIRARGDTPE